VPEMGLVTAFWPLTTTGAGELVIQTAGETRFVVDCKMNPAALVGYVISLGNKVILNHLNMWWLKLTQ
jgi:hypothetical protein